MRLLLLCFFLCAVQLAFGQKSVLDSLYKDLKEHPQGDTVRANILFSICKSEIDTYPEKSKAHADELLMLSRRLNYTKGVCFGFHSLSEYYYISGDYGQAIKYAYEMLRAAEEISNYEELGFAYDLLGRIQQEEKDYENSEKSFLNGIEIVKKAKNKRALAVLYNNLAGLYFIQSEYDLAADCHSKCIEIMKEIGNQPGLAMAYSNLGVLHYFKQDYDKALFFLEKGILISSELDNRFQMATGYSNMGEVCIYAKDYDKANYYLQKSISIAKGIDYKSQLLETYSSLALLEQKRGRIENMSTYFDLKFAYHDSIYTEEKAKQIAEMQTRYETEKKNQTIELLERDKRIQAITTSVLIAICILLGVSFLIFVYFQRYRHNKNLKILNLKIDYLSAQYNELSRKPQGILPIEDETAVESYDQVLLKKAIAVVENNIGDPLFGIEKMAEEIGMSRSSLQRRIKSSTGFPPSELIRNIRLRKAALMLKNKSDSISQISFLVGFDDPSYFTKSFKKQFGVPPSEYVQSTKLVEALTAVNQ